MSNPELSQFISSDLSFAYLYVNILNNDLNEIKNIFALIPSDRFEDVFKTKSYEGDNLLITAIDSDDIEIFNFFFTILSSREDLFQELLIEKNKSGDCVLNKVINSKIEVVEKILSFLLSHPNLLSEFLTQANKEDNLILQQAVLLNKVEIVKAILSSTPPEILRDVLTHENKHGNPALHQAISLDKLEIVKAILSSIPPEILHDIILQKDKDDFDSIYLATIFNKVEIVKAILSSTPPEILHDVLTHQNKRGNSAFHQAIESNKPEIVKAILSSTPPEILSLILQCKNKFNENLIIIAVKEIISSEDLYEKEKSEAILKLISKKQFGLDINEEQQAIIVDYLKNHMLLNLMSLDRYSTFKKAVINILSEVVNSKAELQSNPISQIYRNEIKKILTGESIDTSDNKHLFIYSAAVSNHASYLAFCVDKTNNKLLSITYCDGNYYYEFGDKKVSMLSQSLEFNRFYGVRSFEVREDIIFSNDFAIKFVEENFKGKDFYQFKFPFKIDGRDISFGKITHSIDTQIQNRGNCGFKSLNLLARFLFEQTRGLDHHAYYKKFKDDLRKHVIKGLGQDYQKIKEAFSQDFVDSLTIKENLQKISQLKFGKKNSKSFEEILKKISRDDFSLFQDRPDPEIKANCFSCLISRRLRLASND